MMMLSDEHFRDVDPRLEGHWRWAQAQGHMITMTPPQVREILKPIWQEFDRIGFQWRDLLEVGFFFGMGALGFIPWAKPGASVTAIDDCSATNQTAVVAANMKSYLSTYGIDLTFHKAKSETFWQSPESLLGKTFDLIHIDGDHHFRSFMWDLAATYQLLRPEGILLIDDIREHNMNQCSLAWQLIKPNLELPDIRLNWEYVALKRTVANDRYMAWLWKQVRAMRLDPR